MRESQLTFSQNSLLPDDLRDAFSLFQCLALNSNSSHKDRKEYRQSKLNPYFVIYQLWLQFKD